MTSSRKPWEAHFDYWVRPHLNYPRRPLTDILRMAAADVPDAPATAFLGAKLTYAEVKHRADRFATALARLGIVKGDREIAVVARDSGMRMLLVLDLIMPTRGDAVFSRGSDEDFLDRGLIDTDMKIVDLETGLEDVPVGSEGELCIAGPQVMKGYWNRTEETADALRKDADGRTWLYTGDVARMDADGFTYIVQRKKDMIIVSGFNVYPGEVESVLFAHPAVMEAAVIGVPDSYRGEAVKAFIVLKPDANITIDDLRAHCAANLAEFKRPVQMEIRELLPKSAVGKVLRRVLRDEGAS